MYVVAWTASGRRPRGAPHAAADAVVYIGESGHLRRRMGQFGNSAGFVGEQRAGHSGDRGHHGGGEKAPHHGHGDGCCGGGSA